MRRRAPACAGGLDNALLAGTGAPASSRWKRAFHYARLPDNQLCRQVLCCEVGSNADPSENRRLTRIGCDDVDRLSASG